jgi:hypothetical protein
MTDSGRRGKKRPTLVEGFNNVPNILEEARQAVDAVNQPVQNKSTVGEPPAATRGRKGARAGPKGPKAVPRKKSVKESGRQKKPPHPPVYRGQPAPPAPLASNTFGGPLLGLAYFGISVKHAITGRIRLRLPTMLHNEALAEELSSLLAAVPGITSAEASTATGSLLITFNPRDLASANGRQNFAQVMHKFFPGLYMENLIKRMLSGQ